MLTIVVCSTLCLQPDGDKKSKIQYEYQNCPAYWLMEYKYQAETQVFDKSINTDVLKNCIKLETEDLNIFEDIFEKDLEKALGFVRNDMNEDLQDSVDIQSKVNISKKRKLCAKGHINDNVRANRKVCDREACNAPLDMRGNDPVKSVVKEQSQPADKVTQRANMYLNVPNVWSEEVPKEFAVGATAVNPNKPERIAKVLDNLIEATGMKNQYSVKLVINGTNVQKVLITNESFRKHIVVTADGLPYKIMISLIENTHTCAVCGKTLTHIIIILLY